MTISSAWERMVARAPRHLFVPDLIWHLDPETGTYQAVDRADAPDVWRAWADADVPVVTQWDGGRLAGRKPGEVATSSASQPSMVAGMLDELDVRPGHRVLDVGAGTGWTTALLTALAGQGSVTAIEYDPDVAEAARRRLKAAGFDALVVTGDGAAGCARNAPYDRVQGTYAVLRVPAAWIEQARPGALIVAPWRTRFVHHGAVVRLTVGQDGSASGPFTRPAEFMQSRPERTAWVNHADYVPPGDAWPAGTVESSTSVDPGELWGEEFAAAQFAVGLAVPDVVHTVNGDDGTHTAWFYSLRDLSWAVVFFDGGPAAEVYQGGARRLFDEIEAAYAWWVEQARPGHERFGLTVTLNGETPWLDTPDRTLPGSLR